MKNVTLFDFQKTGSSWLTKKAESGSNSILADEMGLGKTLQVLSYLENMKKKSNIKVLIVSPSSLVFNWKSEIEKYTDFSTEVLLWGEREKKIKSEKDIFLTSYGTLVRDYNRYLKDINFTDSIFDEAQNYKNEWTKTYRAVKMVSSHSKRAVALTGTPIENSPDNLTSIMKATGVVGSLQSSVLRRTKDEVENQLNLPELKYHYIPVDLHDSSKKLYNSMIDRYWRLYFTHEGLENKIESLKMAHAPMPDGLVSKSNQLGIQLHGMRMQLVEVLDDPQLLQRHLKLDEVPKSSKTEVLKDLLDIKLSQGKKVIVFSQFVRMIDLLEDSLNKSGIKALTITGKKNAYDRVGTVEEFNSNAENSVLLVSLKSGNVGLNITGADTIVFYDSWWNPATENQAIGRAWRIGQKNTINTYKIFTKGTIEESIIKSQDRKKKYYNILK